MEKEEAFIKEYKELLEKYNVSLHLEQWADEWGNYTNVFFKENGNYCNIHYTPDTEESNSGYRGMGR